MRNILYIHGFASSGNSPKGNYLKSLYNDSVLTPSLKSKPSNDILQLKKIISVYKKPILIGSSLGGFYAEYLSKTYNLDALLINPLTNVNDSKTLIGKHFYFESGIEFEFKVDDFLCLSELRNSLKNYKPGNEKRIILTAKDDKVIPYNYAIEHFTGPNDSVITRENGGHSFNNFSIILQYLEKLSICS